MPRTRRAETLRRIFMTMVKYDAGIYARRMKLLSEIVPEIEVKPPEEEWAFEWTVLEQLEESAFEVLEGGGIPNVEWPYYLAYLKRVWERMMKFTGTTLQTELESLRYEFVERGLLLSMLTLLEPIAQYHKEWKESGLVDESLYLSKFKVMLSASQAIPSPGNHTVQFDVVDFDLEGEYNLTNYRFEPKVAGYYFIRAQVNFRLMPLGNNYSILIYQRDNGGVQLQQQTMKENVQGTNCTVQGSTLLYIVEGGSVYIQAYQSSGVNQNLQSQIYGTLFEGFRVG